MAVFGKIVTLSLLAHAMAMPKIQHRADGSSGFDPSQYFNNEKFSQYLQEKPSALDYFNLQSQSSPPNNAIQSDTMEDSPSQFQMNNYQDYMKNCMSQNSFIPSNVYSSSQSSSSSSSTAGSTTGGTKAENNNASPYEQYSGQLSQFYPSNSNQLQSYEKCRQQFQNNIPSNVYQPPQNFQLPNNFQAPNGFWPSSSSNAASSSNAGASSSS